MYASTASLASQTVLRKGPFADQPDVAAVDLGTDVAATLHEELVLSLARPRAVVVSPDAEPFPPDSEVQHEAVQVASVLAQNGVEAWLMTRGLLLPEVIEALIICREKLRITFAFASLDPRMQQLLEPDAAPVEMRLAQLQKLKELGIEVQVCLDPLLPGVTDTSGQLNHLLETLASSGIRHVSAGYLCLRAGDEERLKTTLEPLDIADEVLDAFEDGVVLHGRGKLPARYLSKRRRQHGYANLMALASRHGISVGVNCISNPDFRSPCPRPVKRRHASLAAWFARAAL